MVKALENVSNLREYSTAMDILSRSWLTDSDGTSRLDWARNWTVKWFGTKRTKVIRRNPEIIFDEVDHVGEVAILDVGSCNGLLADALLVENGEKSYQGEFGNYFTMGIFFIFKKV